MGVGVVGTDVAVGVGSAGVADGTRGSRVGVDTSVGFMVAPTIGA